MLVALGLISFLLALTLASAAPVAASMSGPPLYDGDIGESAELGSAFYAYGDCLDFARPPPTENAPYTHDVPTNSVDPAVHGGRVPRALLASEMRRVTPSGGPNYIAVRPDFSPTPNRGGAPGSRPGKPFTQAGKDEVLQRQAAAQADGIARCASPNCQVRLTKPLKSESGVTPPRIEAQVDQIHPRSKGGSGDPSTGQALCRVCNRDKWDEW
jgi:hypothetical protein